jgi:hypothetical protein
MGSTSKTKSMIIPPTTATIELATVFVSERSFICARYALQTIVLEGRERGVFWRVQRQWGLISLNPLPY